MEEGKLPLSWSRWRFDGHLILVESETFRDVERGRRMVVSFSRLLRDFLRLVNGMDSRTR